MPKMKGFSSVIHPQLDLNAQDRVLTFYLALILLFSINLCVFFFAPELTSSVLISTCSIGILVVFCFAHYFVNRFFKNLARLQNDIIRMSCGDFSGDIELVGIQEIDAMSRSLRSLKIFVKLSCEQFERSSISSGALAVEVAAIAHELTIDTQNLFRAICNVNESAPELLRESKNILDSIDATSDLVHLSASPFSYLAEILVTDVSRPDIVRNLTSKIGDVHSAAESAARLVSSLEVFSNDKSRFGNDTKAGDVMAIEVLGVAQTLMVVLKELGDFFNEFEALFKKLEFQASCALRSANEAKLILEKIGILLDEIDMAKFSLTSRCEGVLSELCRLREMSEGSFSAILRLKNYASKMKLHSMLQNEFLGSHTFGDRSR